jgi:hypothetical protein
MISHLIGLYALQRYSRLVWIVAFRPAGMGYNRAITIISPDDKLYQVEHVSIAVRQGWTAIELRG